MKSGRRRNAPSSSLENVAAIIDQNTEPPDSIIKETIQEMNPNVRFILATTESHSPHQSAPLNFYDAVLIKPFKIKELVEAIEQAYSLTLA
jgi:hypothetical protein